MMDESFTHSLYIGRDKALEVARRRQAVERELKEKREAKIREQNERIARAQQQKEAELRERIRQRQEKELQKQKAVLDRRCYQLEKDKCKMKEILSRAHSSASRPAQVKQKKVYAFGSSTPRELSYLETKRFYNPVTQPLNASTERLSISPLANCGSSAARPPLPSSHARTPSRIVVGGGFSATPKSRKNVDNGGGGSMMTRSVYATLGGGGPVRKPPVFGGSRSRNESSTNSSINESGGGTSSVGGGSLQAKSVGIGSRASVVAQRKSPPKQQPSMTQSLYEPLPSKRSSRTTPAVKRNTTTSRNATPTAAAVKPPAQRTFNNGTKVTKSLTVSKKSPTLPTRTASAIGRQMLEKGVGETEVSSDGATAVARPPPIRPRKAAEKPLTMEQRVEDSQTVVENQKVAARPEEKIDNGDEIVQNTTFVSLPSIDIVACGDDDLVNDGTAEKLFKSQNCVDTIAHKLAAVSLDTAAADVRRENKGSLSATTDSQLIDLPSIGGDDNVSSSVMEWMNRNETSSIPDDDGNKEASAQPPLFGGNGINRVGEDHNAVVMAVTPVVEAASGLANGGGGGSRDEWDSDHESNSAVEIDAVQQLSSLNKESPLSSPKGLSVEEAVAATAVVAEEKRVDSAEKRRLADAHQAAEREREARRQKLNEILKRTRVNDETSANGNGDANTTARKPSVTATTNIDATALAQELLAQRRQMKMQTLAAATAGTTTTANGSGTGGVNAPLTATSIIMGRSSNNGSGVNTTPVTPLGDELASAGFFISSLESQQNVTVMSSFRSEPNPFPVTNGVGNCDASITISRLPGEVLNMDGRADMAKKQPLTSAVDLAATSTTTSTSSNGTFIQESEPVTASM